MAARLEQVNIRSHARLDGARDVTYILLARQRSGARRLSFSRRERKMSNDVDP